MYIERKTVVAAAGSGGFSLLKIPQDKPVRKVV